MLAHRSANNRLCNKKKVSKKKRERERERERKRNKEVRRKICSTNVKALIYWRTQQQQQQQQQQNFLIKSVKTFFGKNVLF